MKSNVSRISVRITHDTHARMVAHLIKTERKICHWVDKAIIEKIAREEKAERLEQTDPSR